MSRPTRAAANCSRVRAGSVAGLRTLEGSVHPLRIEPAAADARLVRQVHDAQDLLRRAAEGDAVRVGGHNVGLAVTLDTLILVLRTIELVAGARDCVCGLLGFLPHLIELRAGHSHMISL